MVISELKFYTEKETIQHVNSLMFERIAGTKGEDKAINYIKKELNRENIQFNIESFKWSKTIKILATLIMIFIIFSSVLYKTIVFSDIVWIMFVLVLIFIALTYILVINFHDMTHLVLLGKRRNSKNIIAKISAIEKQPKRPLVIFSAHYDSISSRYPYNLKKYFYLIMIILGSPYIVSSLVFTEWTILANSFDYFNNELYERLMEKSINFSYITFLFLMISIIVLLLNRERSESLGSLDNASGVSILIELAKRFNKNPLKNMDVLFLWCGAEEWGLWGSKQFCAKNLDDLIEEYDLDKSYNINIDMLGSYIGLVNNTGIIKKRKNNGNLISILEATAKRLNVPLIKYDLTLEPRSDQMSFRSFAKRAKKKMQVCCFISNKDTKFIHTSRDTPNKCSSKNLNGCLEICYNAIKSIDLRV